MVADNATGTDLKGSLAALGSALRFAAFTVALRWCQTGFLYLKSNYFRFVIV